jgi:ParB-like partition proteins
MKKKVLGRGLGAFFPDYDENQGTSGHQAGSGNSGSGNAGSGNSGGATQTEEAGNVAGAGGSHSASSGSAQSAQTGTASAFSDPAEKVNTVLMIPVGHIRANPHQPRTEFKEEALEELAASIREHGLIQPVTVRYLGSRRFELISGERRLRASTLAGLKEIPAYIREADDEQMIAFALIENIQREELHPLEIAMGYQRLIEECGYTQQQVAERVEKTGRPLPIRSDCCSYPILFLPRCGTSRSHPAMPVRSLL